MTEQTASKIPKIRFKGFEDGWLEDQLGERVEFFSGLTYSPSNVQKGVGTLVLRSSNVKNGEIVNADNVYVDPRIVNSKNVEVGDIAVVVRNGSRSLIGKHAQIKNRMDHTVIGAFMTGIHSESPAFTNALLDTPQFDKEIAKNLGATINQITTGAFRQMMFRFPRRTEQTQIGEYFRELDRLIGLHQRKHDKLLTLKKAMLQKMFPQLGATTPEIRFKGFSGEWVKKKLGELMPITSAARVHKHEWTRSGVPFFRTSDVVSLYKGEENARTFISLDLYEKLSDKIGRIKRGDILITGGGSIGIPFLAKSDDPLYFKDADLLWLKVPESIDSIYLYTFFSSDPFREYLGSISHIGTIGHYTVEQAKKTPITIPLQAEQQKIGTYFRTLDSLISKHATQLQKLQQIKSACLEKMFV